MCRVTERQVRISKRSVLSIKTRRFRTAKSRRSRQRKQLVIPIYGFKTKELAICKKRLTRQKPAQKTYTIVIRIHPKVVVSYALIVVGLVGLGLFGLRLVHPQTTQAALPVASFSLPTPDLETDFTKPVVMKRSEPVRIQVPRVKINTAVSPVGRLADGSMETPEIMEQVTGWYKYSPTPGELGPSVIVGHVDTYKGPSVFWRLRELQPGDVVEVTRTDGSVAKFSVVSVRQFDQSNFPSQDVYGDINHAGLRLITCGGTFNRTTGHYTENTVVFAILDTE